MKNVAAAFTSFLTVLAALPYELGELATVFPPSWKAPIALTGAIATLILRAVGNGAPKK